jgi:amidohydrolase
MIENLSMQITEELIEIRRDLHRIPELEFELYKTSSYIQQKLREYGIEFEIIRETAITGVIYGKKQGKTILLRADMDALPIEEKTNISFASIHKGFMHACGHDIHMTCLIGALKILNDIKDKLTGNVRFVFQPAEEGEGGAQIMIDSGIMENPHVDAAFALHVEPFEATGNIQIKHGAIMASPDNFEFTVYGKGGHGAYPNKCIDPILTACMIVNAMQSALSRSINPMEPYAVSVCNFNAGTYPNIIPDIAHVEGTARSFSLHMRDQLAAVLKKTAYAIAESMGASCDFRFIPLYPPLINNCDMNEIVKAAAKKMKNVNEVIELNEASMAGDDFSYFSQLVPASYFKLGVGNDNPDMNKPLHSAQFMVNEKALPIGASILAQIAFDFLS